MDKRIAIIEEILKEYRRIDREKSWKTLARPSQREPMGDWRNWLILAGRGFGKTRTGAETLKNWLANGSYKNIAIIGQNMNETRKVMVEGESGLLNVLNDHSTYTYYRSKGIIEFKNGAKIELFGADYYEKLRGPQFDAVWIDELGKFRKTEDFWQQLNLALRLGKQPRCIITTTPRKNPVLEKLQQDQHTVVTKGTSYENAKNLAPNFFALIKNQYGGTRLESQEILGQYLSECDGALWHRDLIKYNKPLNNHWQRIVVAVDPAVTDNENSDETGIVVVATDENGIGFVLEDASVKAKPQEWTKEVVRLYHHYHADRVVAETNKGGDMVQQLVKTLDPHISYKGVRATRGKSIRAEPIVSLYEQGKIFHLHPFETLEKQLCNYIPGISSKSPDRLDALVWGLTDLFLSGEAKHQPKTWGLTF